MLLHLLRTDPSLPVGQRNLDEKLRNMQWEAADSNKHHTGRIAELEEQLRQVSSPMS